MASSKKRQKQQKKRDETAKVADDDAMDVETNAPSQADAAESAGVVDSNLDLTSTTRGVAMDTPTGDARDAEQAVVEMSAIVDGHADIAITPHGERMRVEAVGRLPFQKIYLHSEDGKTTNKNYNPEEHGPEQGGTNKLPIPEEFAGGDQTKEYLIVGLVIGDDPLKYKPTGISKSKTRDEEQSKRGILPRHPNAMRAVVPVEDYIQKQAKFYVACRPQLGRCTPRVVPQDAVFFFNEFRQGCEGLEVKQLAPKLSQNCKYAAARNKEHDKRTTAVFTDKGIKKWASSNPLKVAPVEDLGARLLLYFDLWKQSQNPEWLRVMLHLINTADPDLKYGPHTSADGLVDFLDFEAELSSKSAQIFSDELLKAKPAHGRIRADVIEAVRANLKSNKMHEDIPHRDLAHFLAGTQALLDDGVDLTTSVKHALLLTKVHVKDRGTSRATADLEKDDLAGDGEDYVPLALREVLEQIVVNMGESQRALVEQHGPLFRHENLSHLLASQADALDYETQSALAEQVSGIHAMQVAVSNQNHANHIEEVCKILENVKLAPK